MASADAGRKGFLYLLKNPEAPEGTSKVGRTNNHCRRITQYPKNSKYVEVFGPIENCHDAETHLIAVMRSRFLSSDFGREYFHGDFEEVREFFHDFCYNRLQQEYMTWMAVPMELG